MKTCTRIAALLAGLFFLSLSNVAIAGVKEGVKAYEAEHYAQALKELKPLAEQGNAKAQ